MWETIFGVFLFLLCMPLVYLIVAFRFVHRPYNWVVELNIPKKATVFIVWKEGIHFLWLPVAPFMYVRSKIPMNDRAVELRIGEIEGEGSQGKIELEDCAVTVFAQIVYRVTDPIKATYRVNDYQRAVINKIEALIRQSLGGENFDSAIKEDTKKNVITAVREEASPVMSEWGIELVDVSIVDFNLNEEDEKKRREILGATKDAQANVIRAKGIKDATILAAEGEKDATILRAQGEKEAEVNRAQAEKIRQVLVGEGEGERIKQIAEMANVSPQEVMAFIRSPEFFKALEKATIISMGEGSGLNFATNLSAVMNAVSEGMKKGGAAT